MSANDGVWSALLKAAFAHGSWAGELELRDEGGAPVALEGHAALHCDQPDRPASVAMVFIETQQVTTSERELRAAQNLVGVGSWEWDPRIDRLVVSDAFRTVLGLKADTELRLSDALAAMPEEDQERVRGLFDGLLSGERHSFVTVYRLIGSDGDQRWLESSCYAIGDGAGEAVRVVGVAKDITSGVASPRELAVGVVTA